MPAEEVLDLGSAHPARVVVTLELAKSASNEPRIFASVMSRTF